MEGRGVDPRTSREVPAFSRRVARPLAYPPETGETESPRKRDPLPGAARADARPAAGSKDGQWSGAPGTDETIAPQATHGLALVTPSERSSALSVDDVLKFSRLAPTSEAEIKVLNWGLSAAHSVDDAIRLARATR